MKPTRTEVIVAAALGMVLLVLVMAPVIRDAHELYPRTRCPVNLKQDWLGLAQYAQDFDGRYPWRIGSERPEDAWLDLGMLYPNYNSAWKNLLCPSSKDRPFDPRCVFGDKRDHPFEPLLPASTNEVISYAYGIDARNPDRPVPWTENASPATRLLADRKAGVRIGAGTAVHTVKRIFRCRRYGRSIAYNDGHVALEWNGAALDPDEADPTVGTPNATDYRAWWSDPPYYGE